MCFASIVPEAHAAFPSFKTPPQNGATFAAVVFFFWFDVGLQLLCFFFMSLVIGSWINSVLATEVVLLSKRSQTSPHIPHTLDVPSPHLLPASRPCGPVAQVLWNPIFGCMFFGYMGAVDGMSPSAISDKIKNNLWTSVSTSRAIFDFCSPSGMLRAAKPYIRLTLSNGAIPPPPPPVHRWLGSKYVHTF